jgi:hypothetical protein
MYKEKQHFAVIIIIIIPTNRRPCFLISILRNNANYASIATTTEIYVKSVIPSSIQLWNELQAHIRDPYSRISLYNYIKLGMPPFYIEGDRVSAVYHARIRNTCSNLNSDLFTNHLTISAACQCGSLIEDTDHFLQRRIPENSIRLVLKSYSISK